MHRHKTRQTKNHPWAKFFALVTIGGAAAAYFLRSRSTRVTQPLEQGAETSTDWIGEEISTAGSNGAHTASNIPGVDPVPPREPF